MTSLSLSQGLYQTPSTLPTLWSSHSWLEDDLTSFAKEIEAIRRELLQNSATDASLTYLYQYPLSYSSVMMEYIYKTHPSFSSLCPRSFYLQKTWHHQSFLSLVSLSQSVCLSVCPSIHSSLPLSFSFPPPSPLPLPSSISALPHPSHSVCLCLYVSLYI